MNFVGTGQLVILAILMVGYIWPTTIILKRMGIRPGGRSWR